MPEAKIENLADLEAFYKKVFTSSPLDQQKDLTDKEELIKVLLDLRQIRVEHKELYTRRINALNPLVASYYIRVEQYRNGFLSMTKKINLIDDVINFLNEK
jgi:hypothetical protein